MMNETVKELSNEHIHMNAYIHVRACFIQNKPISYPFQKILIPRIYHGIINT